MIERVGRPAIRLHPSLAITDRYSATLIRWTAFGLVLDLLIWLSR